MTQPELGIREEIYSGLPVDELAETILLLKERMSTTRQMLGTLEYEVHCRLVEEGTNALPSDKYEIGLKFATPTYDVSKIRELGELLPPSDMAALINPAYIKQEEVPEKVNGRKARSLITKYKGPIEKAIDAARTDKGRVRVAKKK